MSNLGCTFFHKRKFIPQSHEAESLESKIKILLENIKMLSINCKCMEQEIEKHNLVQNARDIKDLLEIQGQQSGLFPTTGWSKRQTLSTKLMGIRDKLAATYNSTHFQGQENPYWVLPANFVKPIHKLTYC